MHIPNCASVTNVTQDKNVADGEEERRGMTKMTRFIHRDHEDETQGVNEEKKGSIEMSSFLQENSESNTKDVDEGIPRVSQSFGYLLSRCEENKSDVHEGRPKSSPNSNYVPRRHEDDKSVEIGSSIFLRDKHPHRQDMECDADQEESVFNFEHVKKFIRDQRIIKRNELIRSENMWFCCTTKEQKDRIYKMTELERVRVVVRVRPMTAVEEHCLFVPVTTVNAQNASITMHDPYAPHPQSPKTFSFDKVFDTTTNQVDLFNHVGRPVVEKVMEGYNGTILAYGQTGSGKTYTMQGTEEYPETRGIIPNCFTHIFSIISEAPSTSKFVVRVAYVELYNEEIHDLLKQNQKLQLADRESPEFGVYIKDLSGYVVGSVDDMEHMLQLGNKYRAVAATTMNLRSSRSHAIFMVAIDRTEESQESSSNRVKCGKLILVDLAGPECIKKFNVTGTQFKEASKINLSLLCLGNVIAALTSKRSSYVPYRNSKLTKLLQNSLGGNSKTVMIANIGPANYNYEETLTTLRFANRAKNITNEIRENNEEHPSLLKLFDNEISDLRSQIIELENSNIKLKNKIEVVPCLRLVEQPERGKQIKVTEALFERRSTKKNSWNSKPEEARGDEEYDKHVEVVEEMQSEYQEVKSKQECLRNRLCELSGKILIGGQNLMEKVTAQKKLLDTSYKKLHLQETQLKDLRLQLVGLQEQGPGLSDLSELNFTLSKQCENLNASLQNSYSVLKSTKLEAVNKKKDCAEQISEQRQKIFDFIVQNEIAEAIIQYRMSPQQHMLIKENLHWVVGRKEWKFDKNLYNRKIQELGLNKSKPVGRNISDVEDPVLGVSKVYLSYTGTYLTDAFHPRICDADPFIPPFP